MAPKKEKKKLTSESKILIQWHDDHPLFSGVLGQSQDMQREGKYEKHKEKLVTCG